MTLLPLKVALLAIVKHTSYNRMLDSQLA